MKEDRRVIGRKNGIRRSEPLETISSFPIHENLESVRSSDFLPARGISESSVENIFSVINPQSYYPVILNKLLR